MIKYPLESQNDIRVCIVLRVHKERWSASKLMESILIKCLLKDYALCIIAQVIAPRAINLPVI